MTSFLLTEIALDLLGNKFYTTDGDHVRDLQALYKLTRDVPSTGEPSLCSLLGISETSLKASDNFDSNIIVLEDDDEEENIAGEFAISSASGNLLEEISDSHIQHMPIDDLPENDEGEVVFSTSTANVSNGEENLEQNVSQGGPLRIGSWGKGCTKKSFLPSINNPYNNGHDFTSDEIKERLTFIMEASAEEYARMRNHSNNLKQNFLDTNRTLINLRSLKEEDFLKRFYIQQKISLIEESNSLMQFIKIVKNEESHSKDVLIRVAGDILKAKDLIA